jgi:hypothetical protein
MSSFSAAGEPREMDSSTPVPGHRIHYTGDAPWWETGYDSSYSPDNPPGPNFSADQKQEQRKAGLKLLADLRAAYAAGQDSFTISPGDYRFGTKLEAEDSFVLEDMDRDGKTPFRILGYGATLWFDLRPEPAPFVSYMVRLTRCSNITLEGVIIDSDPRGVMEGKITALDFEGNRIQIQPLEGTQLLPYPPVPKNPKRPYHINRFIPFKADGRHIPAYYQIETRVWGPYATVYDHFTTEDGRYWLELKETYLLDTLKNSTWRDVYGSAGTLEIGDMLCVLWSNMKAIYLHDCKQITVRDVKLYSRSFIFEDGYGGNRWINCRFTPRPGTNNLQGGDGGLASDCLVGSVIDGQVNHRTTDDPWNYRAVWRYVDSIEGRRVTFRRAPTTPTRTLWLFERGDKAEFYDVKTKQLIGVFTVDSVEGLTITFQEPLVGVDVDNGAIFPRYQNNGWIVRNCLFLDCFQRFLIHAGDGGLFENNRMERFGSDPIQIHPGRCGEPEGGVPDNLVIRDNVIIDSAVTPSKSAINVIEGGHPIRNLTVRGNLFCNTGRETVKSMRLDGLTIEDNIVVNPFEANPVLPETEWTELPAFTLDRVNGATIRNNTVVRRDSRESIVSAKTSSDVTEANNAVRQDPQETLEARIRELTATHDRDARAILEMVRTEADTLVKSTEKVQPPGKENP